MMKSIGTISGILLSSGIGKLAAPDPGIITAFIVVFGAAGIGFVLGTIADAGHVLSQRGDK